MPVILAESVGAFTNDSLIVVSRHYSSDTVVVGDTLNIRFRIENGEPYPLYGFFLSDQIPTGFRGVSSEIELDGVGLDGYDLEVGYDGEIYSGSTPNRWIFETPPEFREAAHIPPGGIADIEYSVECPETGVYCFANFNWTGGVVTDSDTLWVFGYDDDSLTIVVRETGVNEPSGDLEKVRLCHFTNYPNPFTDWTIISYELPGPMYVFLSVYGGSGMAVGRPFKGEQLAGRHSIVWNREDLPSGVYFLRLEAGQYVGTRKIILMK